MSIPYLVAALDFSGLIVLVDLLSPRLRTWKFFLSKGSKEQYFQFLEVC